MRRLVLIVFVNCILGISNIVSAQTLYFSHIASNTKWETEICLINTSITQSLSGTLTAYSNSGSPVTSTSISLGPGVRHEMVVGTVIKNPAQIGYILFESSSDTICGYTKFYIDSKYRVAIPATSDINSGDIFIPHIASNPKWWTGISLLNTTASSKELTIEFSDGTTKVKTIAAGEHQVFSIKSLFGNTSQPAIKSGVIKNGAGLVGLELFGSNEGTGENYLSGILLKDETSDSLFYPHIAKYETWWTGIVAYNPSTLACNLTIAPYQKDGTALASQVIQLSGNQKYIGTAKTLNFPTGSAWFKIDAAHPITGFELFGTNDGRQLGGYTGVGISGTDGIFPKLEKDGWTGIAFVNIDNKASSVTITAYDNSGNAIAEETLLLSAYEKVVNNVVALFSSDIDTATYVRYSSTSDIVGFQLNGSNSGMLLDALPGDNFESSTKELLTSKTIGQEGGTLAVDDFSLTIPPGVFTTPVELELYKINNSDSFGPGIRTDTFRVTGIPDEFPETLLPDLKYTGTLTDESFIVVGEEVLISSQSAPFMAYHLFPATPDSGVLTCGPEMAVADIQSVKEDFPPVRSNDAGTTRFLDFFGITGWSTYGTDENLRSANAPGHFLIRYPTYFVSRADLDPLFQYLEEAYTTYENMGFSYGGRTRWPIEVTVMHKASDTYGNFCKSFWGNNSATLEFNQHKLGDLPALRTTAGHEFFHFIQYLYDSRNNFSRNHDYFAFSISLHWLDEATAVWAEGKFTDIPNYVSPIREGHKMAPFDGMEAGSGGNIISAGYHGYGMSAFIKYLVGKYGESIVRDIYLKILDQQHPIQAINQNLGITDNLFMIWEPFLREYVTGAIYNVTRERFTGNASGIFQIQSEADTSKSFTEGYPDLSAKLFMIRLDYPDISPAKAISFAIDQDVCDITLFKFRMADTLIQYLSHSTTKQLIQKDLRSLTDDGYYLLVMVTNSNYFAPYINTKQIKLDILIESIAAAMSLSASPNTLNAGGTSASTITATVTDDVGNPVEGETVTFTTDSGGLSASSADTNASGIASVQYTAPASAPSGGTSTITATTTNEIIETVVITVNEGSSWPGWPAPQWCPITGANHVIDYPNGNPDFVTCVYHGNRGSISEEIPYYKGSPDIWGYRSRNGVEKQYFESGKLQIERPWQDNKLNGTERRYYESGQLQVETPYIDDKKNGIQKVYHIGESGYHLIHETPYIDDKKNGLEKKYVYSGQLQSETPWKDDKIDGIKKTYYYLTGQLHTETPYVDGKLNGTNREYYESGTVKYETPYVDNMRQGISKGYYETGQVWFETPYVDSKKNGTKREYYESGTVKYETPYVNDEKNGTEREYYESGQLKVEIPWENGVKNGQEKWYSVDGDMTWCGIYDTGTYTGTCMP